MKNPKLKPSDMLQAQAVHIDVLVGGEPIKGFSAQTFLIDWVEVVTYERCVGDTESMTHKIHYYPKGHRFAGTRFIKLDNG